MADMWCCNCERKVGTTKNVKGGLITMVVGAISLFIPILGWIVSLPLILIGIVMMIFGGKRCSICNGKNLLSKEPEAKNEA